MCAYKKIDTVCPYCGTGCVITCTVDTEENRVIEAKGSPRGVNNEGRLCLKGLYGWDYLNDPQILTKRIRKPMIRKNGKGTPLVEVSWQEAIEYAATRLKAIIKEYGPDAVMGAGSARGPGNEAAYIPRNSCAPSSARTMSTTAPAFDTLHRLPDSVSPSVKVLCLSAFPNSKMQKSFSISAIRSGLASPRCPPYRPGQKKGCKIICVDPRLTETGRIATIYLPIKGGTNMLFLNTMAHVIVTEDLVDHDFIEKHTTGFADYAKEVAQEKYAPEAVAAATHLDPGDIRRAARLFASSKHTMTLWGMGITQFSQGVECVIACSNLSLMTGNYGHYATGVGPVRGQNNVQGTCDMGVLPNQYPGYQDVTDDAIRHKFERAWGVLPAGPCRPAL